MSRHRDWDPDCKVYIGNLGNNGNKYELEDSFGKYGTIKNVWVARNPPGFAFVEFEDARDAEDSVRGLDGTRVCGSRVRVEMSNGKKRDDRGDRGDRGGDRDRGGRGGGGGGGSGRGRDRDRSRDRSRSRSRSRGRRSRRSPSYRSMSRSRSRSGGRFKRGKSGSKSD